MSVVIGYDATHANIGHLPRGQAAGYTTGSGGVPWTAADWSAHPGAVRICQDNGLTDTTADVADVESGAGTPAHTPGWASAALANYRSAKRPGQRSPAVYTSASNVTAVVNALIGGGIKSGIGLWVANWNLSEPAAAAAVLAAAGPFPVIGIQFTNAGVYYDTDVFSAAWLSAVSGKAPPPPPGKTWQEWTSGGLLSLTDFAHAAGIDAPTFLRIQVQHYGAFGPQLFDYLNAIFTGKLPVTAHMPAGIKLWTLA